MNAPYQILVLYTNVFVNECRGRACPALIEETMIDIVKSNYVLDLRGVECPLNFVKTKIQLEKMNQGEVLEIWLDPGEAIESVPPSVREEGHEILGQEKIENYFKVIIKKNN